MVADYPDRRSRLLRRTSLVGYVQVGSWHVGVDLVCTSGSTISQEVIGHLRSTIDGVVLGAIGEAVFEVLV